MHEHSLFVLRLKCPLSISSVEKSSTVVDRNKNYQFRTLYYRPFANY